VSNNFYDDAAFKHWVSGAEAAINKFVKPLQEENKSLRDENEKLKHSLIKALPRNS